MKRPMNFARSSRNKTQRGVALITTLLLLLLVGGMTIAMTWSALSDMRINGNYNNFRGSFYAADSGLSIVRQAVLTQLQAGAPAVFAPGVPPIPIGYENIVRANIMATYGAFQNLNTGTATQSWPGRYRITNLTLTGTCVPKGTTGTCAAPAGPPTAYSYSYNYLLTAQGQSAMTENTTLQDSGTLTLTATIIPANIRLNFAAWGMFIDQYDLCSGGTLVPGTITGPVFTNGSWNFGSGGSYTFTDPVGSAGAEAGFQNGSCVGVAGPAGNGITPKFNAGFKLGQPKVPLPKDSFNQERAVLDGKGATDPPTPVTNTDRHSSLKDIHKTAYPTGGANSGVYLPYTVDASGNKTFTGGGIYVQGDASVVLTPGQSPTAQVYTITQNGTTTTVTVDTDAKSATPHPTTTMSDGTTTQVIQGMPNQLDPVNGTTVIDPGATMLFVNGNITSLSGPGQGQPAIQDGTQLTVTGASNITITGDILYKAEPVTLTGTSTTPIDTLIPANNTQQVLGIFTANGDIQMNNKQANGNLEIDASIATLCDPSGSSCVGNGGLVDVGKPINQLTIVGGRIQNQIKNIGATTRNVLFDRRFAQNNFAPPWFPSTDVNVGLNGAQFTSLQHRTSWLDVTSTK